MKRRFAIMLAAFAVSASAALGQAKLGLYVVDSTGQRVSYFSSADIIFINGAPYQIDLSTAGLSPNAFTLWYPTTDCSGTAYLPSPDPSQWFGTTAYTSDGVIHYPPATSPEMFARQSYRVIGSDDVPGTCTTEASAPALYVPAASVPSTFTPPFRLVESLAVSPAPPVATFNDVPTSHPFFQFIEALHAAGITGGCQASPPLYCPDNSVTRGQMAVFLAKALGL
jgi:S-layer homology domain